MEIKFIPQLSPQTATAWQAMDYIVSGAPLLVYDGKVIENFHPEKISTQFINKRYARTAIGILPDKKWLLVSWKAILF